MFANDKSSDPRVTYLPTYLALEAFVYPGLAIFIAPDPIGKHFQPLTAYAASTQNKNVRQLHADPIALRATHDPCHVVDRCHARADQLSGLPDVRLTARVRVPWAIGSMRGLHVCISIFVCSSYHLWLSGSCRSFFLAIRVIRASCRSVHVHLKKFSSSSNFSFADPEIGKHKYSILSILLLSGNLTACETKRSQVDGLSKVHE